MLWKNFNFTFQKENIKYLCGDYNKWSNKLADLGELLRCMLQQINDKRLSSSSNNHEENSKLGIVEIARDFLIDEKLEEQRFLVDEKKMQMIQVESKINALGSFDSKGPQNNNMLLNFVLKNIFLFFIVKLN